MGKGGRLSYSEELAQQICDRLEHGETLSEICAEPPWPKVSTVYNWINNSDRIKANFAAAREIGEDFIASGTRRVARGKDFEPGNDVQRDKLVIDTDLRLLSYWNPKKYSDKKQIDLNVNVDVTSLFEKMENARVRQLAAPTIDAIMGEVISDETPVVDAVSDDEPLW